MPRIMLILLALTFFTTSVALAKRSPPAEVAPVKAAAIEYRVSHKDMGCVEAWDAKQNELIWRRQVYAVKYNVDLERDVQDVFITSIEVKGDTLLVKNERQSQYKLDLNSLEVTVVKGALVEGKK